MQNQFRPGLNALTKRVTLIRVSGRTVPPFLKREIVSASKPVRRAISRSESLVRALGNGAVSPFSYRTSDGTPGESPSSPWGGNPIRDIDLRRITKKLQV